MSDKVTPAASPAEKSEVRRHRPRGRGKRLKSESPAGAPALAAREKKRRQARPAGQPGKRRQESPAWLLPVLVFLAAVTVGVLALIASRAGR